MSVIVCRTSCRNVLSLFINRCCIAKQHFVVCSFSLHCKQCNTVRKYCKQYCEKSNALSLFIHCRCNVLLLLLSSWSNYCYATGQTPTYRTARASAPSTWQPTPRSTPSCVARSSRAPAAAGAAASVSLPLPAPDHPQASTPGGAAAPAGGGGRKRVPCGGEGGRRRGDGGGRVEAQEAMCDE